MKPVMCEKKTYTVAEIMQILGKDSIAKRFEVAK